METQAVGKNTFTAGYSEQKGLGLLHDMYFNGLNQTAE